MGELLRVAHDLARVTGIVRRSFREFVGLLVQLQRLLLTLVPRDVLSSQWTCPQTQVHLDSDLQISSLKDG